jgi:hypothetical protein
LAMREERMAQLAFVGAASSSELASDLRGRARQHGFEDRVFLTGRVDESCYRHWLDAADIAVQLRRGSRGETSGAIIDALSTGLPVIVNAHGSAAELPIDAVVLLPDRADCSEIGAALAALWADPKRRTTLSQAAEAYARNVLAPGKIASLYHEAIEDAYAAGPPGRLHAALPTLPEADLTGAASALTHSFPTVGPRGILLDSACISQAKSATRASIRVLARQVLLSPGESWIAELVNLDGQRYTYSRRKAAKLLGLPDHGLPDLPVSGISGDILVVLAGDGQVDAVRASELRRLQRRGVRVIGLFQGIPSKHQSKETRPENGRLEGLAEILGIADAVLCTSHGAATRVLSWLNTNDIKRRRALDVGWLYAPADSQPLQGNRELEMKEPLEAVATESAGAFLRAIKSGKWPMSWAPPVAEPQDQTSVYEKAERGVRLAVR